MANGPIRRTTEKAVRDRAGVPVLLFYDEENDKTIMARASEDGELHIMGTVTLQDRDGDPVYTGSVQQNNQDQLYTNTDTTEGELEDLLSELRIMNVHLSGISGMHITKEDIGDN
jgi:hypothetical protein